MLKYVIHNFIIAKKSGNKTVLSDIRTSDHQGAKTSINQLRYEASYRNVMFINI